MALGDLHMAVIDMLELEEPKTAYEVRSALRQAERGDHYLYTLYPALFKLQRLGLVSQQERRRAYLPRPRTEFLLTFEGLIIKNGL